MESLDEFLSYFNEGKGGNFWKTVTKGSLVPLENIPDKRSTLEGIYYEICSGIYSPSKPRAYILINKRQSVVRLIPVFNIKDTCVYFYCTKRIEALIYGNRVPNTFGGWSLGGAIRSYEQQELAEVVANLRSYEMPDGSTVCLDESFDYAMPASFNPLAWKENWSEFMRTLYANSRTDVYEYVAELDIANFYDNINIDTLRKKLENLSPDMEVNGLLFNFLKNCDLGYIESKISNKGIPQDEVADCSRLIANYYIQDYDEDMYNLCGEYGAKYFRYSDDQLILAPSKTILEEIVSRASVMILKYGLCFNHRKVKIMKKSIFEKQFSFDWFISRKEMRTVDVITLKQDIAYFQRNRQKLRNGGISVLLRILSLAPMDTSSDVVEFFKREILNTKFLTSSKLASWQLSKIYGLLDTKTKSDFVTELRAKAQVILLNRFHYVVRSFLESIGEDIEEIDTRIRTLNELFRLQLDN